MHTRSSSAQELTRPGTRHSLVRGRDHVRVCADAVSPCGSSRRIGSTGASFCAATGPVFGYDLEVAHDEERRTKRGSALGDQLGLRQEGK
jgi:hypothetical protein